MPNARHHLFPVPLLVFIPTPEKRNDATGGLMSYESAQQSARDLKINDEYDSLQVESSELHAVRPFPETGRTPNSPPSSRAHPLFDTERGCYG